MIILGLLLVLGVGGLSVAAILANRDAFDASAGAVELFGYQANLTVGQVFLAGAAAGAVILLGLLMLFSGMGRSARRRSSSRRELRDLQRKHEGVSSELAAQRASEDNADERDEAQTRQ